MQLLLALLSLTLGTALAQTSSVCNPLTTSGCPADPALGTSINVDFTKGAPSTGFTEQGVPAPVYDPNNGLTLTVAASGDAPELVSSFYIMFGRVDVVLKAAPGVGIVSSFILISDDLDEIDWEWLGAQPQQVQTNYFGKGITGAYDRSAFENAANSESEYRTYTIEWTSDQIVWQIDGQTVRVLTAADAEANQYPQTPMQVKFGIWSGGDPSNSAGTVAWAGGSTNYAGGPYSMYIKSLSIADYSTGTSYSYTGTSGAWSSISAAGGKVNPSGSASPPSSNPPSSSSAAKPSSSADGSNPGRLPTTGAGSSLLPWQTDPSKATTSYSNYPGLPSGWTVSNTGKAVPPSSASGRMEIPVHRVVWTALVLSSALVLFWRI